MKTLSDSRPRVGNEELRQWGIDERKLSGIYEGTRKIWAEAFLLICSNLVTLN